MGADTGTMSPQLRTNILRISGVILILLGILHLAVTPMIAKLVHNYARPQTADWFSAPMMLNHIVLGILLLPLGFLTAYAAEGAGKFEPWASVTCRTVARTVATLPVTVFVLMNGKYDAPAFRVATVLICVASLTLLAASFWPRRSSPMTLGR